MQVVPMFHANACEHLLSRLPCEPCIMRRAPFAELAALDRARHFALVLNRLAGGLAFSPLIAGAKLVLPGANLDGKSIYDLLEGEKVTLSAGVPTVWQVRWIPSLIVLIEAT